MKNKYKKILISRTDRIGDLILTFPSAAALKKNIPDVKITYLIKKYTRATAKGCSDVDDIIYIDNGKEKSVLNLVFELKKHKFDAAVILFPTFKVALSVFLARIPERIGTGYRWYSFLFNRKVFEHRKYAQKHEVDFNLRLIKELGVEEDNPEFNFKTDKESVNEVENILNELGLKEKEKLVVVHPGSGGSALEWPTEYFGTLTGFLSEIPNVKVIVTWGENEKAKAKTVKKKGGNSVLLLNSVFPLKQFIALISKSYLVITNSTGPIHIAVMLNKEVIGIYPPIKVCSYRRWGPYGKENNVFVPDVPACKKCVSSKCKYYNCMFMITPEMVSKKAREILGYEE